MRNIVTAFLAFVIATTFAYGVLTSPDRPAPKKDSPKKMPAVADGPTNWGKLTQAGKFLKIEGHAVWEAIGEIRPDGRVYLLWTLKSTGEPCPGVYEIDSKGDLVGDVNSDWVRRVEAEVPEIR